MRVGDSILIKATVESIHDGWVDVSLKGMQMLVYGVPTTQIKETTSGERK